MEARARQHGHRDCKLSELNKNRLGAITTVWSLAVVFFCITCMGKYAMTTTDTTSVWNMSYKPFIWFAVFGCVLLFLAMLSHLLDQLAATIRGGGMGSAFLMLGIGLLAWLSVWVAVERPPRHQRGAGRHRHGVYVYHVFLGMPVAFALWGPRSSSSASLRQFDGGSEPVRDGVVLHVQQLSTGT